MGRGHLLVFDVQKDLYRLLGGRVGVLGSGKGSGEKKGCTINIYTVRYKCRVQVGTNLKAQRGHCG